MENLPTLNALRDLLMQAAEPKTYEDGAEPFVILPEDCKIESIQALLPMPNMTEAKVRLDDMPSFLQYVSIFSNEATKIFCSGVWQGKPSFCACLDFDQPDKPSHRRHWAIFTPPLSEEWHRWIGAAGQPVSQTHYARFMEENAINVKTPAAADMVEISRSLEATRNGAFKSTQRLDNGDVEFEYVEQTTATSAGKRKLQVPERFTISIPVFFNSPPAEIECFLRYRIKEGELVLFHEIHRLQEVLLQATWTLLEHVQKELDTTVLVGEVQS